MMTVAQRVEQMMERPFVHVFPGLYCQLTCTYCSQPATTTTPDADSVFTRDHFSQLVKNAPPSNFLLSGGEPLMSKGIGKFVKEVGEAGHKSSLQTNLSISTGRMKKFLDLWDPEYIGYFVITHHGAPSGPKPFSWERMYDNVKLLKEAGILLYVKYVGVPELIPQISEYVDRWTDVGVGSCPSILLSGNWKGKSYPTGYTDAQFSTMLKMTSTYYYALQFFGGFRSQGMPCHGGRNSITYNMSAQNEISPCCHMGSTRLNISSTVFGGAPKQLLPCQNKGFCYGGRFGIMQEHKKDIENWIRLLSGSPRPIDPHEFIKYCDSLQNRGFNIGYPKRYNDYKNAFLLKEGTHD